MCARRLAVPRCPDPMPLSWLLPRLPPRPWTCSGTRPHASPGPRWRDGILLSASEGIAKLVGQCHRKHPWAGDLQLAQLLRPGKTRSALTSVPVGLLARAPPATHDLASCPSSSSSSSWLCCFTRSSPPAADVGQKLTDPPLSAAECMAEASQLFLFSPTHL